MATRRPENPPPPDPADRHPHIPPPPTRIHMQAHHIPWTLKNLHEAMFRLRETTTMINLQVDYNDSSKSSTCI
ncbi:hypothetical protein DAI22_05g028100 [Oryza sativa Japonica Group]|nr:hypothetical protein DAI22_05g028100 [Oryza sativa Japonica Group]